MHYGTLKIELMIIDIAQTFKAAVNSTKYEITKKKSIVYIGIQY